VVAIGAVGIALWIASPQVASQRQESAVQSVLVTNFPDPQNVQGKVGIEGPIQLAEMVEFEGIIVPPVPRSETTRLVEAGTLQVHGFPSVVLSLHGQVKGDASRVGAVGAILIPDSESITTAFREHGLVHFAMEVAAPEVSMATPYFASNQPRYSLGFQAYRVFLYNATDKTVTAHLFAYLTN
jgi:hypothetical protein